MKKMFYVYVLRSIESNKNYIGMTNNVFRRLREHNKGKSNWTKKYRPWKLLFYEEYKTSIEARSREKWLKSGIGRNYINDKWPCSITG